MNTKRQFCWLTSTFIVLLCISPSFASTRQPKTVLDYFLLLPQRFFEIDQLEIKRKKWLYGSEKSIVDLKNDYLRMQGDGAQGTLHVALFRHKGKVLVAVLNEFEEGSLTFLRYENGNWKYRTKEVMPIPYNDRCTYVLPRYGTTIKVTGGNGFDYKGDGKHIYDLIWVNGKFKVKRYPK